MLSLRSPSLLTIAVLTALNSVPASAQQSDQQPSNQLQADKDLEVIEVKGRAQTLYRASQSSVGTRTDTDLELIPQNIQVLPEALIRDQAARQVTDLYRSMSGVSAFSYSGVTFRGFRQDEILYDGVRGDPFNGFAVPQLFNVQEVQLLKGSSGALYGSSAPGGLINYVTKKPQRTAKNQLELGLGNDEYWQGSLELSGPLTEQQAYRFGYYRDSEQPFRWNTKVENEILDLGYLIDLTDSTSLTLQYNTVTQDYQGARLRGVPTDDQGNFLGDRAWNHNEATDFQSLEADVWQIRADHEFNSNWRTDLTWRHYDNTELQNYHEPFCSFDTDGDGVVDYCRRQFRDQRRENTADSVTWNNIVEFSTAGLNHQLLLGADTMTQDSYFLGRNVAPIEQGGKALGISLINPVYGLTSAADYDIDSIKSTPTDTTAVRQGFYLQDQVDLTASWNLLLGVRWDSFEDKNNMASSKVDGSDSSWRVGSTYQLTDWVRLYALKGTGFSPQATASQVPEVGGPFEAEQSSIVEAGARFSLLDDAIRLNVATYEMIRNNILQADPRGDVGGDGRDDQIALGEVKSKGVEVDLLGDLTDSWVLNLNYAYNDTRIVESTSAITNAVGDKFANAPQHQIGVWSRYELDSINSAIAAGMDYVSDQLSIDGQHVKSYTVFDMSWQTRWQQWLFQANVKNLFDKTYATAGFIERTGHFPGEPRRLIVTASYQF
ncbi:MAG TPA: TonB-dependent receptor [Rheinheimera sp.]|uniref:TonB-dependent siderophore receptor n=1 Tax=Rheinheimera sp. TaxID=1869214 RepID=UPI002B481BAD|nr:TonB-dependent receptor [Rheinheimera sp.]HJS15319.1 TonB-dependent receptor [Rheinheimera sp.]